MHHRIPLAAVTIVVVGAAAGCSGGQMQARPTRQPDDAKRSIQRLVDDTTTALGGTWTTQVGPRLGTCKDEHGDGAGINYTVIAARSGRGDAARDIATLEHLWRSEGLETTRFATDDESYVGLDGRGTAIANIGFRSSDLGGGDTVTGTSACAAGDYAQLRKQERS
ncbi:hypothetical protein [Curtobacterium sp. VKM Ac-2922]|uniref:hypothetical protein n=1 Tax=Curtobacterium sp. VKM Ac-2922 TaxID=2929475 RepID=UPI001FB2F6E0|nr:hypothetical protein [Curtobacterium sp. VKM Ac-2922]MCJ1715733.1 hypothetical protein [Curtobacterium sp. VKM Ac-2922]